MKNKNIEVKYKTLRFDGAETTETKTFKSWDEDGSYTIFYDDVSLDSVSFLVPTRNVISIELNKEASK